MIWNSRQPLQYLIRNHARHNSDLVGWNQQQYFFSPLKIRLREGSETQRCCKKRKSAILTSTFKQNLIQLKKCLTKEKAKKSLFQINLGNGRSLLETNLRKTYPQKTHFFIRNVAAMVSKCEVSNNVLNVKNDVTVHAQKTIIHTCHNWEPKQKVSI